MSEKTIFEVRLHPSGRYTLMEKTPGNSLFVDPPPDSPLFGNNNKDAFYHAVAQRLDEAESKGELVDFRDVDDENTDAE